MLWQSIFRIKNTNKLFIIVSNSKQNQFEIKIKSDPCDRNCDEQSTKDMRIIIRFKLIHNHSMVYG